MAKDINDILNKYEEIIKEEINIKEIWSLSPKLKINKVFKPLWSKLSAKFGKDTGNIIQLGKQWNIKEIEDGQIIIFDDNNERTLAKDEYEIAYEWLEWDDTAIEGNIIAKLDLEITPQLLKEGISREISRFINQMRKEADYTVDTKVTLLYNTDNPNLEEIINEFSTFLKQEALLNSIEKNNNPEWDIKSLFTYDENTVDFALKQ